MVIGLLKCLRSTAMHTFKSLNRSSISVQYNQYSGVVMGVGGLPPDIGSGGLQINNQFMHNLLFHKIMVHYGCHVKLESMRGESAELFCLRAPDNLTRPQDQ